MSVGDLLLPRPARSGVRGSGADEIGEYGVLGEGIRQRGLKWRDVL